MVSTTSNRGVGSPRQFKAPIGLRIHRKVLQKDKLKGEAKQNKVQDRPEAQLLRNPRPKAVVPYVPKTELEDGNLRFLIHHCKLPLSYGQMQLANEPDVTIVSARTVTNVGPRFEWYPLAVRDEAFFHALISSVSSHAAYLQKLDLPPAFFRHRGEAIRLLNKRIAIGAHDEGTINTVAVFAQQEVRLPTLKSNSPPLTANRVSRAGPRKP